VPKTDDVIVHADIVEPGKVQTIHFTAPAAPGRYPYLCTFPGHWKLMNGVMIVEEAPAAKPE
jgi:azurin